MQLAPDSHINSHSYAQTTRTQLDAALAVQCMPTPPLLLAALLLSPGGDVKDVYYYKSLLCYVFIPYKSLMCTARQQSTLQHFRTLLMNSLTCQNTNNEELKEVSAAEGFKSSGLQSSLQQHSELHWIGCTPPVLLALLCCLLLCTCMVVQLSKLHV